MMKMRRIKHKKMYAKHIFQKNCVFEVFKHAVMHSFFYFKNGLDVHPLMKLSANCIKCCTSVFGDGS